MAILTLEETARHLRVDSTEMLDPDFLADLSDKIEMASVMVLRYVNLPLDSFQDSSYLPVGVPYDLRCAALIWVGILFKHRDGTSDEPQVYGQIPKAVSNILVQRRKPPVA